LPTPNISRGKDKAIQDIAVSQHPNCTANPFSQTDRKKAQYQYKPENVKRTFNTLKSFTIELCVWEKVLATVL